MFLTDFYDKVTTESTHIPRQAMDSKWTEKQVLFMENRNIPDR
ncbi:hypothetical protein [Elizabethkingia meningoseptica]|nr:hypothetical protein [Elizabethkingia meningoseptica]MEC4712922.1 hypothetical protein [Elizabethkingia meningoseptica]